MFFFFSIVVDIPEHAHNYKKIQHSLFLFCFYKFILSLGNVFMYVQCRAYHFTRYELLPSKIMDCTRKHCYVFENYMCIVLVAQYVPNLILKAKKDLSTF